MTSITDVTRAEPPAPWFRWQPEWTIRLMTWVVGGLIAGGSAGLGVVASWQTLQADEADVTALRAADAEQAAQHANDIAKLVDRQNRDDQLHSGQVVADAAIQKDLDRLYKELVDFRRDLTGRGIR
jgi:hypothetical protein